MHKAQLLYASVFLFGALALSRSQGAPDAAAETRATEIPIGGIILWWGRASDIPEGFEACDGTAITTRDAVLRGAKPNLQNKFPRGAASHRSFAPQAFAGGGNDKLVFGTQSVPIQIADHKLTLTANELPAHTHDVPSQRHRVLDLQGNLIHPALPASLQHSHTVQVTEAADNETTAGSNKKYLQVGSTTTLTSSTFDAKIDDHPLVATSSVGNGRQITLTHGTATANLSVLDKDNRPAFVDMVFLIRVK